MRLFYFWSEQLNMRCVAGPTGSLTSIAGGDDMAGSITVSTHEVPSGQWHARPPSGRKSTGSIPVRGTGVKCYGSTAASKTVGPGSTPGTPATLVASGDAEGLISLSREVRLLDQRRRADSLWLIGVVSNRSGQLHRHGWNTFPFFVSPFVVMIAVTRALIGYEKNVSGGSPAPPTSRCLCTARIVILGSA